MSKKLRVGLVGAGSIVRDAHLNPGWKLVPDCEVAAVCDIFEPSAKKLAADFEIPLVFTDLKQMLKLGLDCVDICTPNLAHTSAAIAALNAGAHVLCEKPLAVSVKEIDRIAAAARKNKRMVMTAQHMRFMDKTVAVKRFIEAGHAGDFYHARVLALRRNLLPISPNFIDSSLSGGGVLMDMGVHALDTAMYLLGSPKPVRVSGQVMANFAKGDSMFGEWGEWDRKRFNVEDFASGYVHFENGMTMGLEASWLQNQKERQHLDAALYGRKGTIHWPSGEYHAVTNRALVDGTVVPTTGLQKPHTEEILAFARAIREGLPSPVPVEQSRFVIAILEGIYKSAKLGREIKLDL